MHGKSIVPKSNQLRFLIIYLYMLFYFFHSTNGLKNNDGADDETVVCALLHDIGDVIAPANHSQAAAALLKPYVSETNYWIVLHHGLFQGYYWMHHYGEDRNSRDALKNSPYYEACVEFCERWDQKSFDPKFETRSLEHFLPVLKRVFLDHPLPETIKTLHLLKC
jgi:predicted HD phosphohydrolase